MTETGNCAWPKCKKTGQNWQDGKCYCEKHYGALKHTVFSDIQPVGKVAMGASTVIINDSAS